MAYKYAEQRAVTDLNKWCMNILHDVQKEVSDYFTFDIRLIGSGDKRLVTQNAEESFDLDYNIILQKDKKGLLDNPKQIKDIFIARFNKVLNRYIDNCYHSHSEKETKREIERSENIPNEIVWNSFWTI